MVCFFFPLTGLFAAAHDMNIEWVIVKGISHFSDDSNTPDKSWKSFASIMAASVVSNMLNDPVVFKKWPHYEGNNYVTSQPFLVIDYYRVSQKFAISYFISMSFSTIGLGMHSFKEK